MIVVPPPRAARTTSSKMTTTAMAPIAIQIGLRYQRTPPPRSPTVISIFLSSTCSAYTGAAEIVGVAATTDADDAAGDDSVTIPASATDRRMLRMSHLLVRRFAKGRPGS